MAPILIWTGNIRIARIMAIIMGIITAGFLLTAGIIWGVESYKINSYAHVKGTVADFDTRDGKNVWTEFEYSLDGQTYTVRLKGHSYWMRLGSEINLVVNPKIPDKAEVLYDDPHILSFIMLLPGGLFGVFLLLYLVNFLVLRRREQKG